MPWDRGYYYRSVRRNGRPRREYVGGGRVAVLVSQMDEIQRQRRQAEAAARRSERGGVEDLDRPLAELDELADLAAEAALLAAGYHRHKRGEWRRRREQGDETGGTG